MRDATITGNVGQEPKVVAPQGSEFSCIKFSIANNDESKKDTSGSYINVTSWFDIEFWTKKPQYWLQQIRTGVQLLCPCEAKQETWKNQEGANRSKIIFKIRNGMFPVVMRSKNAEENNQQEQKTTAPAIPPGDDCPF